MTPSIPQAVRSETAATRRELRLAVVQMAAEAEAEATLDKAESFVRQAAKDGAQLVLTQELLTLPYFCRDQEERYFELAETLEDCRAVARFRKLAAELGLVLPVSFFERAGQAYFNSLALIDADGALLGLYRKSHIPDGPGYQEKYYFSPGDTGFKTFTTKFATIGAAICWDQWFPEAARAMALMGAELLLYPTAIGSEPAAPELDTMASWRIAMRGHAVANRMPVAAANRVGTEMGAGCAQTFYGSSFIAGPDGALLAQADREEETVLHATLDLAAIARERAGWGFFRDRRPDLYSPLTKLAPEA